MPPVNRKNLQSILYVDDDSDILALVQMALQEIGGFQVQTLSSTRRAVTFAETMRPDLIMLDMMMPGLDGASLFDLFKKNEMLCDTPIVFMTARVQPADIARYIACGAAGIISKPFNPITLPRDIRQMWDSFQEKMSKNSSHSLDDLKQRYLKNLPVKREAIEAFIKQTGSKRLPVQAFRKIEELLHNLAGSGGTYGYRAITNSARALEKMVVATPHSPELQAVGAKLLAAIDRALLDLA